MSTKNTEGRYSPNKVPSKPCLIKHLLNDGTCLEKNCHNHGLVGNRLGVYSPYSRLMLNKPEGKESWKIKKTNILRLKQVFSKSDRAGSFGTASGPILTESWAGNEAIWFVDFSYWPSELT